MDLLDWCRSVLGAFEVASDHSQLHPGTPSSIRRLRTASGCYYVKTHRGPSCWESEVHAYERWAAVFGSAAPRLIAVRDEEPRALIISQLPGRGLEKAGLPVFQERSIWRSAGRALRALHDLAVGTYFGPCRRNGTCHATPIHDAREYVSTHLVDRLDRAHQAGCLRSAEVATVHAALDLVPCFEGERPVPCHRDYCPGNWLVADDGVWTGVIDFEFASWDVRVADFTRYPDWDWMARPDLLEAFLDGYDRSFTPNEEQQRLVAHVAYALTAVVWGNDNSYLGFAKEGHAALRTLAELLR